LPLAAKHEGVIMTDDKVEPREINWRHLLPWTAIFQGFRVALDLNKLFLAAVGILLMAIAWLVLAWIFNYSKPQWGEYSTYSDGWARFKAARQAWNLMHESAGDPDSKEVVEPEDLADTLREVDLIKYAKPVVAKKSAEGMKLEDIRAEARAGRLTAPGYTDKGEKDDNIAINEEVATKAWLLRDPPLKPAGRMRTLPWFENRGSNPYLLVTGRAGVVTEEGTQRIVPWEKGHFVEWLGTEQAPALLEPLAKMLRPLVYFFSPRAGALARIYFLLVLLVTVAIWGVIGGAITRIAAVQIARQEKIGAREALTFTLKRYLSLISAPIFPLIFIAVVVVAMILFGVLLMIPILGEFLGGLLWPLMILAGLGIAVLLVGLVGWPMMAATISTEGTDSWEAVSRSYSYVFGKPWHYVFYSAIALLYGALLIFFVGFMGSAMVYFAKWGVNQAQIPSRDPTYMFIWAPTSYEWRDLLLQGYRVEGEEVWKNGHATDAYDKLINRKPVVDEANKWQQMSKWNYIGTFLVSIWLYLIFLLILGFGYSYFWTASTIVYLLMRRKVDDTELDEVYLEEEDQESPYSAGAPFTPPAKPPAPAAAPVASNVTMVEAPTLRTPPPAEPVAPPPAAAPTGDGNAPPDGAPSETGG
jgi:hypothetical protein